MGNNKQRRSIDEETIDKVVSNFSRDFIEKIPGDPRKTARSYAKRIVEPYFSPSISEDLRKMMLEYRLSDEDYLKTFFKIFSHTYYGKDVSDNPRAFILLSQTGGGKSNLRERILRENPNVVLLDSDSYKRFRPDSMKIQQQYPQFYGALTGIDSYDHLENISRYTMQNGYDFLIESAPSVSQGVIGVNLVELEQLDYGIDYDALAIGDVVSQMAVHKRYEEMLRDDLLRDSAKLTDIDRHNDSYSAVVLVLQNSSSNSKIVVYRRGTDMEDRVPQVIELDDAKESKIETLEEYRRRSNEEYLTSHQFARDYNEVKRMMDERQAPEIQRVQLESVLQNAKLRATQINSNQICNIETEIEEDIDF